ncbi:MAG: hypothetical protein K6U14_07220 [Firmicutes bacterium]|nr:hypothetical protein [Alicyclobacillaceae bacterium]MCL6497408.1 hypothetical protein [Bacillota bacterium]
MSGVVAGILFGAAVLAGGGSGRAAAIGFLASAVVGWIDAWWARRHQLATGGEDLWP